MRAGLMAPPPTAAGGCRATVSFVAVKLLLDLVLGHRVEIIRNLDLPLEEADPLYFPGRRRIERHDFDQRFTVFGDDETLAARRAVDKPRRILSGFVDIDGSHVAISSIRPRRGGPTIDPAQLPYRSALCREPSLQHRSSIVPGCLAVLERDGAVDHRRGDAVGLLHQTAGAARQILLDFREKRPD